MLFLDRARAEHPRRSDVESPSSHPGSEATNGEMVARVAAACGLRTLFVAYRKLPEAPFPGALVDALRGLSWALRTTPPDRLPQARAEVQKVSLE